MYRVENDNTPREESAAPFFSAFYGCEPGRLDPTAWPDVQVNKADHERNHADLADVDPIGMVP